MRFFWAVLRKKKNRSVCSAVHRAFPCGDGFIPDEPLETKNKSKNCCYAWVEEFV